jgi:excisionase family DNA binding protein
MSTQVAPNRPARLLEAGDVTEVLVLPAAFVSALARRGELPAVRVGEHYACLRPEALWAWIEQQKPTRPKGTR